MVFAWRGAKFCVSSSLLDDCSVYFPYLSIINLSFIMKNLILTLVLVTASFVVKAQTQASDKIYWMALQKYTTKLATSHPTKVPLDSEKVIYLEKSIYLDSIPPIINGYKIVLITPSNEREIYLNHHKILVHTKISPVRVEEDYLSITITPYSGKMLNRRHYNLGVSEGSTVYFKYDCDKKEFVFDKIKNWGI